MGDVASVLENDTNVVRTVCPSASLISSSVSPFDDSPDMNPSDAACFRVESAVRSSHVAKRISKVVDPCRRADSITLIAVGGREESISRNV